MRQQLLLPSNVKSDMGFGLAYLHLTLTNSKGQRHFYAQFYDEYLRNGNM